MRVFLRHFAESPVPEVESLTHIKERMDGFNPFRGIGGMEVPDECPVVDFLSLPDMMNLRVATEREPGDFGRVVLSLRHELPVQFKTFRLRDGDVIEQAVMSALDAAE